MNTAAVCWRPLLNSRRDSIQQGTSKWEDDGSIEVDHRRRNRAGVIGRNRGYALGSPIIYTIPSLLCWLCATGTLDFWNCYCWLLVEPKPNSGHRSKLLLPRWGSFAGGTEIVGKTFILKVSFRLSNKITMFKNYKSLHYNVTLTSFNVIESYLLPYQ